MPSSLRFIGFRLYQPDQASTEQGNKDNKGMVQKPRGEGWKVGRKEETRAVGRGRELERKGDVTSSQQRIRRREGENERV